MRVVQQLDYFTGHAGVHAHPIAYELLVAIAPPRPNASAHGIQRAVEQGHTGSFYDQAHAAEPRHFVRMAKQTETSDISQRRRARLACSERATTIELQHRRGRLLQVGLGHLAVFDARAEHARADPLRQIQPVTRVCARLGQHPIRVDGARYRQPVLWLRVVHRMPPGDHTARLAHFIGAATEDFRDGGNVHGVRKGGDIQREQNVAPHGVHIAHGIGRGDGSEQIGVVQHRRKEVQRLHDGLIIVQPVNGGIIRYLEANQQVREISRGKGFGQRAQHLRQGRGAHFRGSTAATDHRR